MGNTAGKTGLDLLQELAAAGEVMREAAKQFEKDSEAAWNALDKEQQLMMFCAVMRRVHQGDVNERRSYRGVLYDVFEFGPEAYAPAQFSGYLEIHNLLYTAVEIEKHGGYIGEDLG